MVYDATLRFCDRFEGKRSRTHDQMVQAARSGKQNILEGGEASGTSTEIKLTGVAKASLKELLEDYRGFMHNRIIAEWPPPLHPATAPPQPHPPRERMTRARLTERNHHQQGGHHRT